MLLVRTVQCIVPFLYLCFALRDNPKLPFVPDYNEQYMYKSLKDKIIETMSVNNCSVEGDFTYGNPQAEAITVTELKPLQRVLDKWLPQNQLKSSFRIFTQVNSDLCQNKKYQDILKGLINRSKGCQMYIALKDGTKKKRLTTYGATLHPFHARCDYLASKDLCQSSKGKRTNTLISGGSTSSTTGIHAIGDKLRQLGSFPFRVSAKEVTIGRGGMFALPCGPIGLFSSCEAVKCGLPEAIKTMSNLTICRDNLEKCPYPVYENVFILTQYDDTQIGQFMQEALPKLIYNLEFLYQNPTYKIHYGFTKQLTVPKFVLPHYFFARFNLLDRLINGTFYAHNVVMPREGGCQDIGYNSWEVVSMRDKFYSMLDIHEDKHFQWKGEKASLLKKPTVLVLTRSAGQFTQNKYDANIRSWTPKQLTQLRNDIITSFPNHLLDIFSDTNKTLMTCPLCQVEKFAIADIVIGFHGAGLSNAMFMRPGGILVEIISKFDSRHVPVVGIFPRVSDIIGLHHFSYVVKNVKEFNISSFVKDVVEFHSKTKLWMFKVEA
jgi:hypothetical protein